MSSSKEELPNVVGQQKHDDSPATSIITDGGHGNPSKNKRRRPFGESLTVAYSSVESFAARPSTGRPDSPHFFFKSSYEVTIRDEKKGVDDTSAVPIPQTVHQHVNGLCIVTVAESISSRLPPSSTIQSIRFIAQEALPCSAAEKRKKQGKMLKGRQVDEAVLPSTVIAELVVIVEETGEEQREGPATDHLLPALPTKQTTIIIPLYACVWGTIIELNRGLTPELLRDDPLLDGYLAVILPSGRFPPPNFDM